MQSYTYLYGYDWTRKDKCIPRCTIIDSNTPRSNNWLSSMTLVPHGFMPIPKHESTYLVNEDWLIYSIGKKMIVNPTLDWCGYLQIRLTKNKKKKKYSVARIVCTVFHGNPKRISQVNHKDLDKLNNHKDNLEWVSPAENAQHKERNWWWKRDTYEVSKARYHRAKTPPIS